MDAVHEDFLLGFLFGDLFLVVLHVAREVDDEVHGEGDEPEDRGVD